MHRILKNMLYSQFINFFYVLTCKLVVVFDYLLTNKWQQFLFLTYWDPHVDDTCLKAIFKAGIRMSPFWTLLEQNISLISIGVKLVLCRRSSWRDRVQLARWSQQVQPRLCVPRLRQPQVCVGGSSYHHQYTTAGLGVGGDCRVGRTAGRAGPRNDVKGCVCQCLGFWFILLYWYMLLTLQSTDRFSMTHHPFQYMTTVLEYISVQFGTLPPHAGSRVVRIDPLRFLAGCCKR